MGVGGGNHYGAGARKRGGWGGGGGGVDRGVGGPPAHPQERAPASASRDRSHAQGGLDHFGRVPSAAGQRRSGRAGRGSRAGRASGGGRDLSALRLGATY